MIPWKMLAIEKRKLMQDQQSCTEQNQSVFDITTKILVSETVRVTSFFDRNIELQLLSSSVSQIFIFVSMSFLKLLIYDKSRVQARIKFRKCMYRRKICHPVKISRKF